MNPLDTNSASFSAPQKEAKLDLSLELPEVGEDSLRLLESAEPTFEQQLAHAALLLRWRKEQGLPEEVVPRNAAPFEL